jgi:YD repeat-containing protein
MDTEIIKKIAAGIFSLFTVVSFGQNFDCKEMGLKGNVKNISETQYKLNDINPGLNEVLLTKFSFNRDCKKTSEITTDVGGDIKNKHTVTYDQSGNIISENRETPTVKGYFTTKYRYDANRRLSKKEVTSNGRLIATHIYHYDDNGNVGKKEIRKKPGYDIYDEDFEYKYDDKNRLVEEIHRDGKKYNKTEYKYNDKDQLVRRVEYNDRGGITYETDYTYDELDNPSVETSAYRGNNTFNYSYVYEYDGQGNWINKRSLSNDKTFSLQIRIITYY